jgi:hypothetical protein
MIVVASQYLRVDKDRRIGVQAYSRHLILGPEGQVRPEAGSALGKLSRRRWVSLTILPVRLMYQLCKRPGKRRRALLCIYASSNGATRRLPTSVGM